jgi:sugar-specific transcriptional regulator TrmB
MKTILNYLHQLGFSDIESRVYLKLLTSGPMTVAELAKNAKVNRTAAYGHINSLLEKGVVAKSKGSASKIVANSPEELHILVEQKAIQVESLQNKLPAIVRTLSQTSTQNQPIPVSETKYYQGRNSVKAIYNECLRSLDICTYFDSEDLDKVFPENTKKANDSVLGNPKQIIREIVRKTPTAIADIKAAKQLGANRHMYKFFPEDLVLTSNDILIYDGKVAIINTRDKENVTGVVLHNKDYYINSRQIFEVLWRLLPENK